MSEEEKKTIDYLKNDVVYWLDKGKDFVVIDIGENKKLHNILNLIDKLKDNLYEEQEQNEYLKDKVDKQQKEIKELKSKYKDLFFQNFELWEKSIFPKQTIEKDYISKDKIRAKIKELEEKSDYWNCDEIQVLEELLEEI